MTMLSACTPSVDTRDPAPSPPPPRATDPEDCDLLPPRLLLSSPPEDFVTREPLLSLTGSVDDTSCTLTVNGTPLPLVGLVYTGRVPLIEGTNALQFIAEDACHNRTTLVRTVHLDSIAPTLSFLQPGPEQVVHQPSVDVLLTYVDLSSGIDSSRLQLLLDGKELPGVLTASASSAFGTVPLTRGPHTLEARVTDLAGNVTQTQAQVLAELPEIAVTLTSPIAGSSFTAPAFIKLTAVTSAAAEGTLSRVDFLRDGVVVGSASATPYELLLKDIPAGTYVLSARAVDPLGGAVLSAPVTITVNPLVLTLTAPVPGALVSEEVLVTGTIQAPEGSGVTVNDLRAAIRGNTFLVRVPVEPEGTTLLTATLTAPEGQSTTRTLSVVASGETPPVAVQLTPSSGFAPLQVEFMLTNRLDEPLLFTFGGAGPYTLAAHGQLSLTTQYPVGVHTVSFDFVEDSGRTTRQIFVIEALDEDALDQQLQAMWSSMNNALIAGDKERALVHLVPSARDKYGPVFDKLLSRMPSIIASYSPMQRAALSPEFGEYAINRTLGGVNRIFFISFERDVHGVWHLSAM